MNNRFLYYLTMVGKFSIYTYTLITFVFNAVLAEVSAAQGILSVKESKITIAIEDETLESAFKAIERNSDYTFVYLRRDLDPKARVTVRTNNQTIESLLLEISRQANVSFRQINERISVKAHASGEFDSHIEVIIEKRPITGKVTDEEGEALPGATVLEKGTNNGTVTDIEGNFQLEVEENATLVVSFVGFATQEVNVGNMSNLQVTLSTDYAALEEVVVVGYGTQAKRDVTGAVAQLKTDEIQNMPQTDFTQMLKGRIAGLSITNNLSTAEGNENSIQIRGKNSINASNTPLIILDNVPYSGSLNEINPEDIASVEVLKDASSAAIYGSRGANGVIILTTKKGEEGKPRISYNGFYAIDEMGKQVDLMDASEWYALKSQRPQTQLTPSEIENYMNGVDTDWIDLATQQGMRMQHNLSFSGGSAVTKYLVSATYNTVEGIAKNDKFDRLTLRLNLDTKINDFLTFGTNTQFGSFDRSGYRADFNAATRMNPLGIPFEEDGKSIKIFPWEDDRHYGNPLDNLNADNNNIARSVITNNYLNVDVPWVEGLSYRINTGYTYRTRLQETYFGRNTKTGYQNKGQSELINDYRENWLIENIVTYKQAFGKHSLFLTGLYSAQEEKDIQHNLNAVGFPSDIQTVYQNDAATTWDPNDSFVKRTYLSQMLRANYTYDGKYLLTLTARRDGYSGFGADTKFGIFPSMAIGWNISSEPFMANTGWIDNLKLRASYGKNGNQAVGAYSTTAELQPKNYLNANQETVIGFYPRSLGDPTLGWETTVQTDIGVDFDLFAGRIQGTFDWYTANTTDLLLDRVISPVNGTRSIRQNIGETKNTGFEFELTSYNLQKGDFSWMTSLNFSHYKNEILNVGLFDEDGNPMDNIANQWFIGHPIDVNFAYVFDGIWQVEDAESGAILNSADPNAKPGQVKVVDDGVRDEEGNLAITPEDRQIIGSRVPLFTAGMMNTFTYKNFSLTFFINTVQGVTKKNDMKNTYWEGRQNKPMMDYWTPDNPINTYPANDATALLAGGRTVDFFEDASFVRLNDITLTYKAPASLTESLRLSHLEIYLNAKNLATWTEWSGLDPEFTDQWFIPINKTYLVGLRFGF